MSNRLNELLDRSRPSNADSPLRVVDMDDDAAVEIFEILGSETTYVVYKRLHEEPKLPRELAATLDSSIQNVHYHLNKLEEAGLIAPVETWHSENGVEMEVYAPVHDPLVLSFGSEDDQESIRTTLSRTFGSIGAVAVLSLLAELLVTAWISRDRTEPDNVAGSGSGSPGEPELLFDNAVIDAVLSTPGLTLFLLGVTLVSVYTAFCLTRQRHSPR